MSDIAKLFAELLETAMILDPAALRAEIDAGRDTGLKAQTFDGPSARSADTSSTVERMALAPRRDRTDADLARHDELVGAYVHSIGEIAVRSRSGAPATTWDGAVKDHNLLDQMDAVGVLERTGQKPARLVHRCGDALFDLERMVRQHLAHVPDATDLLLSGDPICLSHARIGDYVRPRHGDLVVCKTCRDLIAQIGSARELHKDSDYWPSMDLLREHAEMERTGKRTDYHRTRTDWIAGYPPARRTG